MKKKVDSDENKLLFDEIRDLTQMIFNELVSLDKQIKNTQSVTLQELLTKNYAIGSNIYIRFQDIVNLYRDYIKYSSKYSQILTDNTINSNKNLLKNIDLALQLLEETQFDDIKHSCKNSIEQQSYLIRQADDIIKLNYTLDDLTQTITLHLMHLSTYNCYLPFTVNDYNKYKIIKESIINIKKTIAGLIPFLSEFLTAVDVVKDISTLVSTVDDEDMKETFFNNANDDLIKIEKQTAMLSLAYNQQESLIDYLTIISDDAKKQCEEICCKSPNE